MFETKKCTLMARLTFVKFSIKKNQIKFRAFLNFKERYELKEALKELKIVENLLKDCLLIAKD